MKGAKPRLLLIGNTLETFGGGEKWLLDVATLLKGQYSITVLNPVSKKSILKASRSQLSKHYDLRGINIINLPSLGIWSTAFGTESFLLVVPKLKYMSLIKDSIKCADVIYCLTANPILLGVIVQFASIYHKKLIFGVHNPSFYKLFERSRSIKQAFMNRGYRKILSRIRYFHVLNVEDEWLIKSAYPKSTVFRIPNFITGNRPKLAVNKKEFIVLFIARFQTHQKGVDLLPKIIDLVINKVPDIKFHIIGSGGDGEGIIKDLAASYKSNVKWLGFVDVKALKKEYSAANLLVLPSRFEGFPLVVLESQSFGLPVIAFDVKGPREIIKRSYQGSLVAPFDVNKFADLILKFYLSWDNDSTNYLKIKDMTSKLAYSTYSSKRILVKITRMLN